VSVDRAQQAAAVRRSAGLFRLRDRGLIAISGDDRQRWLDGMLTNDVAGLRPGFERSGCYALLLTPKGRIVADLHVLLRDDCYWLETAAGAVGDAIECLRRHVIADAVEIADISTDVDRLALEGPAAPQVLAAVGNQPPALPPEMARDAWIELEVAGAPVVVAHYGWSGEQAFQLFVPAGHGEAARELLAAAGSPLGLVDADPETLEILRIEAGVPALGTELDQSVLPAEARLGEAVCATKGCYVGQEVVARMETAGRVSHLLVGLALDQGVPEEGAEVRAGSAVVGEITSSCRSALAGPIALAFVRSAHAEPGTSLQVGSELVRVVPLPFAGPSA
jgi:folate-binding protein YgfZ